MIVRRLLLLHYGCVAGFSQTAPKILRAIHTNQTIKIDGLTDETLKAAEIASGFLEERHFPAKQGNPGQNTEDRILYDDAAVYIEACINDTNVDSIAREVVGRDMTGNTDFFGIILEEASVFSNSTILKSHSQNLRSVMRPLKSKNVSVKPLYHLDNLH